MTEKTMNKSKKIIWIVIVAILIAAIVTGVIIWRMSKKNSVSETLSLGNNYLSELNFKSAIEQYNKVLAVDPINQDALAGLAASYAGMGDIEMAQRIFKSEDLIDSNNTVALRVYVNAIGNEPESLNDALKIVNRLIEKEDKDEDYELYEQILSKILDVVYEYSETDKVTIALNSDRVETMGTNVLGALGTDKNLGEYVISETLSNAEFTGNAKSVFTTGTLSIVLDNEGYIWSAGSNRSGQQANGTSELLTQSGWYRDTGISNVVKIAGGYSTLFALTSDGKLYVAGNNDGYTDASGWLPNWTLISRYGDVMDLQYSISADSVNICFLSTDGKLYLSNINAWNYYYDYSYSSFSKWSLVSKNVSMFSIAGDNIVYMTDDGKIVCNNGYFMFPEEWSEYSINAFYPEYKVPFSVSSIAVTENEVYLLDKEKVLHYISNAELMDADENEEIARIYSSGNKCVAELAAGGYKLFK